MVSFPSNALRQLNLRGKVFDPALKVSLLGVTVGLALGQLWLVRVKHGLRFIACLGVKYQMQKAGSHSPLQGHTLMTFKGSLDLTSHRPHYYPVALRQWSKLQNTGPRGLLKPARDNDLRKTPGVLGL